MSSQARRRPARRPCRALLQAAFSLVWTLQALADEPDPPVAQVTLVALGAGRVLASATALTDGRLLVVGGLRDSRSVLSARGDADWIDPRAEPPRVERLSFNRKVFPGRAGHAAALLRSGQVLIAGGDLTGSVDLFEPKAGGSGAFRRLGVLPGLARMELTATLLADGRVLVTGGLNARRESTRATDLFDPESGGLTAGPPLLEARYGHTATLLEDGRVLIVGGVGRHSTELFDPKQNQFAPGPNLDDTLDDHAASRLLDGRVLITGGQVASGRSVASVIRFDPRTNRLDRLADMAGDRADHVQLSLPDGSVLVLGGESDDGNGHDTILDSVERFVPRTGKFETLRPLQTARDDHAAALLADGRVAVVGGQGPGDRALASLEFYRVEQP